jgi:D-alanyl-D-alanine carboxypeptidase
MFLGFFYYFTQDFSGSIQNFFVSQTIKNQQAFLSSLQNTILQNNAPLRNWETENLETKANSAVAVFVSKDGRQKILFDKNIKQQCLIASITKLATAIIVLDNYDLSQKFLITKEAEKQTGNLKTGESFTIKNLLYSMLIESDNTAAFALSEINSTDKFVELMNQKMKDFELSETFFAGPTGINPENKSSVEDLIKLSQKIAQNYPLIFEITSLPEFDLYNSEGIFHHKLTNTNSLLLEPPVQDEKIIGGKTGFTEKASGCLLLVTQKNNIDGYFIYIILGSADRFAEMKKLIDWTDRAYKWQ